MVKAFLDGGSVRLTAEPSDIPTIKRLRSASRTNRMPPLTWVMPLTFDAVEELRREKIPCNSELAKRAQAMLAAHRFVDAQKAAERPREASKPAAPAPRAPSSGPDTYTGCRAYGPTGTSIDNKGRRYTKIPC